MDTKYTKPGSEITKKCRVCINHFHKDDVITQYIFPSTEGEPDIIVSIDNTLNDLYIKGITIIILIDR